MSVLDNITKMSSSWFNNEDGGINILREKKRDRSPIRKQKSYYNDSYLSNNKFKNNLNEKQNNKKIFYIGDYNNDNVNTNIIYNEPMYENINDTYNNQSNETYNKNYDDVNEEIEDIYTYIFNKINTKIKNIYNYYCKIE